MVEEGTFFTYEITDPLDNREDEKLMTHEGARWSDTRGQLDAIFGNRIVFFEVDPFEFWAFFVDDNPSGVRGTLEDPGTSVGDRSFLLGAGIGCGE